MDREAAIVRRRLSLRVEILNFKSIDPGQWRQFLRKAQEERGHGFSGPSHLDQDPSENFGRAREALVKSLSDK